MRRESDHRPIRSRRFRRAALFAATVTALLPLSLAAANLVTGGGFDETGDVAAWYGFSAHDTTQTHSTLDANGLTSSGSLRKVSSNPSPTANIGSARCFDVVEGTAYSFGAKVFFPAQTRAPRASLYLAWFDAAHPCAPGSFDYFSTYSPFGVTAGETAPFDSWVPLSYSIVAPSGATSALLALSASGGDGTGDAILHFDDAFLIPGSNTGTDFNGDARADLLWRNYATGAVNVWFLNGTSYVGGANLFTVADPQWRIEGTGDLNGDGETDLVWRNYDTGAVNVWFLIGTSYSYGVSLFTVADPNWEIEAVGDFNGDLKDDLLWRNYATGAVNVWFLDGTNYLGGASLFTVSDVEWTIEASGDFNGDGERDLIWRNYATGQVNVWFLNGSTYLSGASLFTIADLDWKIEAVADYNGDGNLDLIWRNYATGAVNVWFLSGTSYLGGANLFDVAGPSWEIAGPR